MYYFYVKHLLRKFVGGLCFPYRQGSSVAVGRPLFALSGGFVGGRWKATVCPIGRVRRWPLECHFLPYSESSTVAVGVPLLLYPEGSSVAVGRPIFTPPIEFVGNSWKAILPYPLYCRFLRIITYTPIQIAQSLWFSLKEKASQLNNCYNSIHCNFLFVNN